MSYFTDGRAKEDLKWLLGKTDAQQAAKEEATQQMEAIRSEMHNLTAPQCPRCHSKNFTVLGKQFKTGRALVGAALIGPLGLVAGASRKGDVICLDCGKKWRI